MSYERKSKPKVVKTKERRHRCNHKYIAKGRDIYCQYCYRKPPPLDNDERRKKEPKEKVSTKMKINVKQQTRRY